MRELNFVTDQFLFLYETKCNIVFIVWLLYVSYFIWSSFLETIIHLPGIYYFVSLQLKQKQIESSPIVK